MGTIYGLLQACKTGPKSGNNSMKVSDTKDIKNFITNVTKLFSIQAIGAACGFLAHFLLARQLGAVEYGIYNFVFSFSMICALIGNFGFQASAVRLIPQIVSDKNSYNLKNFFGFSCLWIFVLSSFISIIAYQILIYFGLTEKYPENALLIGIGLTPLLALLKLNSGILRGFKLGSWALSYESSLKEIFFSLFLITVFFSSLAVLNAQIALIVTGIILATLLFISFGHIFKLISSQIKLFSPISAQNNQSPYKTWIVISFPMMLVISVQFLIIRSDILMLGFLTDVDSVGVYSAGAKIAQAATMGMMILNILFSPKASELYHQKNHKDLRKLYFKTLIQQAGITLILVLVLLIFSQKIVQFLGSDYNEAIQVIYILLFGYAINCLWGPIPFLMIMTRYEYEAMWLTFGAALANIILNILLIPTFGIIGAAISTIIALNFRNGIAFYYILTRGLLSKNYDHE